MRNIKHLTLSLALGFFALATTANAAEVFTIKDGRNNHGLHISGDIHFGGFLVGLDSALANSGGTTSPDAFNVKSKGEIDFEWKGSLSSDLSYGAKFEIRPEPKVEPHEYYGYLKSKAYGSLYFGTIKSPASKRQVRAPEFYFSDLNAIEGQDFKLFDRVQTTAIVVTTPDDPATTTVDETVRESKPFTFFDIIDETDIDRDEGVHKVVYYTPRVSGFELGISFAPDINQEADNNVYNNEDGLINRNTGDLKDAISFSANYENDFGGFDAAASFGYFTATGTGTRKNANAWNVGANIGFDLAGNSNLSLGGGYLMSEDTKDNYIEESALIVGIAYEIGSWKFGVHYGLLEEEDSKGPAKTTENQLEFGGSYAFNKYFGISSGIELVSAEVTDGTGNKAEADGIVFGTILSLHF